MASLRAPVPAIHATSHVDHEKRLQYIVFYFYACMWFFFSVVLVLRSVALNRPPELCYILIIENKRVMFLSFYHSIFYKT